jgi:hypothetical protein
VLAGLTGDDLRLSCRVPVGDHWEGALPVPGGPRPAAVDVTVRPGSAGSWAVGLLVPRFPERFTADDVRGSLLTGFDGPGGGRLTATVPSAVSSPGMIITAVRVRDVRLELTVRGRPLTEFRCDDAHVTLPGLVTAQVSPGTAQALGLRGLSEVTIDVRSVGRSTDQWAILQVG